MKKTLALILAGLTLTAMLAACGGESEDTTAASTTETPATTTTKAPDTTTTAATTTGKTPDTDPEVTTTEGNGDINTPEVNQNLTWYDNNGDQGTFYVITDGENGAVNVSYTMETAAEAEATNGYPGWSWVNMAADVSEAYDGQTKFVMKIKGEAGDVLWIKPFDDQAFEQTITLDGSEQTITFNIGSAQPANLKIIIFGGGAKPDTSGEFTIVSAYFE